MNRDEFERKTLTLWMETRIPLTLVNVQYHTGAPRKKVEAWLDELVRNDVLEMVVGNDGEVRWKFNGAKRPLDGPTTFDAWRGHGSGPRKGQGDDPLRSAADELRADFDRMKSAADTALAVRDVRNELKRQPREGDRSMLVSAGLSLLFGPFGWLYAGAWKETIPGIGIYILLWLLRDIPILGWFAMPLILIAHLIAIGAGGIYAYKFNKAGHSRQPILDWSKLRKDDD